MTADLREGQRVRLVAPIRGAVVTGRVLAVWPGDTVRVRCTDGETRDVGRDEVEAVDA